MAAAQTVRRQVRFLSVEQVVTMHDTLLRRFGGRAGGGARGEAYEGVDAAVQAVKNSYYETVEELAAAYAVYIVQGHVFLDGNKRTGAAAMLVFLEANGVKVRMRGPELAAMMIELQRRAEAGEAVPALVRWIVHRLGGGRVTPSRRRRRRRQSP
jgi:death-on-curing protein